MSGKPVFFSAQKTDGSGDISGVLTFNQVEGSGFDGATGKFHAPEAGTYGFHFSGLTGNESSEFRLHVFKNGRKHHDIYDGNHQSVFNNVGGSWTFKLHKGEEVYLEVVAGSLRTTPYQDIVHFTGQLLG